MRKLFAVGVVAGLMVGSAHAQGCYSQSYSSSAQSYSSVQSVYSAPQVPMQTSLVAAPVMVGAPMFGAPILSSPMRGRFKMKFRSRGVMRGTATGCY